MAARVVGRPAIRAKLVLGLGKLERIPTTIHELVARGDTILVERTDPITGFAYGLADQMRRPRRRTWEGIMAEAPLRSLYYRVRPRDEVFAKIDPGEGG